MRSFVAVHIVTDTSPEGSGGLLALAAARFEGGHLAGTLDLRARQAAEVPSWLLRSAGLISEELEGAPPSAEAVRELFGFADGLPLVSCRVDEVASALGLRKAGGASRGTRGGRAVASLRGGGRTATPLPLGENERTATPLRAHYEPHNERTATPLRAHYELMDLDLLGRTVFPVLDSHEPAALARHLALLPAESLAPSAQAALIARVWLRLLDSLEQLPWLVLHQAAELLEGTGEPLAEAFRQAESAAVSRGFGSRMRTYAELARDFRKAAAFDPDDAEEDEEREHGEKSGKVRPLDLEGVSAVFREGGLLQAALPGYERREEQERMALAVAEAFNGDSVLLAEAGTGVGKSMAYLAPAVLWARQNHERVVVSTNTKNLQDQLYAKDLPLLARALDVRFETAVVKGRSNYLCVRRFLRVLADAQTELSGAERVALLPLVVWFPETATGDMAECVGFASAFRPDLWARVSTRGDECVGGRCANARHCFVRQARALALGADIIVVNHAVVFSEMGLDSPVLPPYSRIVFDEAHNIEAVATEHFAREASAPRAARTLGRIQGMRREGRSGGILAALRYGLNNARKARDAELFNRLSENADICAAETASLEKAVDAFPDAIASAFGTKESDRVRYGPDRLPKAWAMVQGAADNIREKALPLAKRLKAMAEALWSLGRELPEGDAISAELGAVAADIGALLDDLDFCIAAKDPDYVFWAERAFGGRGRWALRAAPVEVGPFLRDAVYAKKKTVIFSSATLTVGDSFRFMRQRLGLEKDEEGRVSELAVGTSFDFARQAMLGVMRFLPPPSEERAFTDGFVEATIELLRAAKGRALVLFTSHKMLREAHPKIKQALEPDGIRVLAQGLDGDRSRLARLFQEDVSSVLLGAASFWEGVDVAGESLSCLIVARLPFQVHTDPIVEGRCERIEARGGSAFFGYSAPSAAIRLKQGFGRLIRSRGDRGAVIIGDQRIVTKNYGRLFLKSLPVPARAYRDAGAMAQAVAGFLDGGGEADEPLFVR